MRRRMLPHVSGPYIAEGRRDQHDVGTIRKCLVILMGPLRHLQYNAARYPMRPRSYRPARFARAGATVRRATPKPSYGSRCRALSGASAKRRYTSAEKLKVADDESQMDRG